MSLVKQFAVPLYDRTTCGRQKQAHKGVFSNVRKYQGDNVQETNA